MNYNSLSIVVADAAQPPSLAASVAVTIGSGAPVEAPAVAAAVEMGAAELMPYSCRTRRRDLTAGMVAGGKPWSWSKVKDPFLCVRF